MFYLFPTISYRKMLNLVFCTFSAFVECIKDEVPEHITVYCTDKKFLRQPVYGWRFRQST
jgi:hypothetical protein